MRTLKPAARTPLASPRKRSRGFVLAVAAATVLLAFASGCATSKHAAQRRGDDSVTALANEALSAAGLDARRIEARSYRGVVVLLGEATATERRQAERAVLRVPGVVRVNTMVFNEGPSTASGFARSEKAPILARAAESARPAEQ